MKILYLSGLRLIEWCRVWWSGLAVKCRPNLSKQKKSKQFNFVDTSLSMYYTKSIHCALKSLNIFRMVLNPRILYIEKAN